MNCQTCTLATFVLLALCAPTPLLAQLYGARASSARVAGGYGTGAVVRQASASNGASSGVSGGFGDPMFRGLDGRAFFFDGIVGKIFNIITEQDHQLNAEFGLGPHKIDALGKKTNGTFMTAFGLRLYNNKVQIAVDEEGEMTVSVNDLQTDSLLNATNDFRFEVADDNEVVITVERYRPNLGHTVIARTPLLELVMYPTLKQYDPVVKEIARGHLNFELAVNPSILALTNMHGVLGQNTISKSSDTALIADQLATLFLGEGEDEDYIVTELFGSDFKFNRFGVTRKLTAGSQEQSGQLQHATMHMSASRRFLKEGQLPTYVPVARLSGLL